MYYYIYKYQNSGRGNYTMNINEYEALMKDSYDKIYKLCLKQLSYNYHAAEDVTSDVFFILLKKWDTIDVNDNIQAWLYYVATMCTKRYLTNNKHVMSYEAIDDISLPQSLITDALEESYELKEYVDNILLHLDEEQGKLFKCRFVHDMKLSDISKILKIPYSTVWFKINEIKDIIRDMLNNPNNNE